MEDESNMGFAQKVDEVSAASISIAKSEQRPQRSTLSHVSPLVRNRRSSISIRNEKLDLSKGEELPDFTPSNRSRRAGIRKQYMEDEINLLAIPSRIKELRNKQRRSKNATVTSNFNAKEKWHKAYNKLRPIFRLSRLAQQIQLYGSPAYSDAEYHFKTMIKCGKAVTTNVEKSEKKLPFCLIHPKSRFKVFWSVLLILLLLYAGFVTPIRIAFADVELEDSLGWRIAEYSVDLLFGVDIIINMLSAFYDDEDNLVTSHLTIICQYLKSWFIIDFFSCLPLDMIMVQAGQSTKNTQYKSLIRLARLPRLYRLLKMVKLAKILKDEKKEGSFSRFLELIQMNSMMFRLVAFVGVMAFCCNFFACVWYFVTKFNDAYTTWVYNTGLTDESTGRLYMFSLYWVVLTLATIGYGDIHAYNNSERIVSIIWMTIGVCFFFFLIGSMSTFFSAIDSKGKMIAEKYMVINQFCAQAKIDPQLKYKMKKALEYRTKNYYFALFEKNSILEGIPLSLRYQIAMNVKNKVLQTINFFKLLDESLLGDIVLYLQPLRLAPGEIVYHRGDMANEIFFIVDGRVDYYLEYYKIVYRTIKPGDYFGEYEVINRTLRVNTTRTKTQCSMLFLYKNDFKRLIEKDYPELAVKMVLKAKKEYRITKKCLKVALKVANRKMFRLNIQANADIKRKERLTSAHGSEASTPRSVEGTVKNKDSKDKESLLNFSMAYGEYKNNEGNDISIIPEEASRKSSSPDLPARKKFIKSVSVTISVHDENKVQTHLETINNVKAQQKQSQFAQSPPSGLSISNYYIEIKGTPNPNTKRIARLAKELDESESAIREIEQKISLVQEKHMELKEKVQREKEQKYSQISSIKEIKDESVIEKGDYSELIAEIPEERKDIQNDDSFDIRINERPSILFEPKVEQEHLLFHYNNNK